MTSSTVRTACPWSFAVVLSACGGVDDEPAPPPHVLLVVVDAASAAHFGFLSGDAEASPNVDRLARDGVVFENAYGQAPITVTSTASLFTGVRGTTHLVTPGTTLPEEWPTVAELLRGAGYRTLGIVGNPFAGSPKLGFDRGYDECVQVYALPSLQGQRGVERRSHFLATLPADINAELFARLPVFEEGPTYAYLHYLQPHRPYDPPAEVLEVVEDAGASRLGWDDAAAAFDRANETGAAAPEVVEALEARYRANLRFVDEGLGALFDRLRAEGLYDEAWIVLTSDHGEAFFGHGRFGHRRTLYDDMTRVPFVLKPPTSAGIRPGRFANPVETIDVLPTLLDALGLERPPRLEGDSLLPLARGEAEQLEGDEVVIATSSRKLHAIRVGGHKYVYDRERDAAELYDLAQDPGEQANLVDVEPELARELRRRLDELVDVHSTESLKDHNRLRNDPEMDRLLNSLGYVDTSEDE